MKQLLTTLLFLLLAGPLAAQRTVQRKHHSQGTDGGDACKRTDADRL